MASHLTEAVRFQEVPPVLPAALGTKAGYPGAALRAWLALGMPKKLRERWEIDA